MSTSPDCSIPEKDPLFQRYASCTLCPKNCRVNRLSGQIGACGERAFCRASAALPHLWEEPLICNEKGSGAVFFTGCPLSCVFCQNREISHLHRGYEIPVEELADTYLALEEQGLCNLNLVTAEHFLPHIVRSLEIAKRRGLTLPVVYNSSAYEKAESLRLLDGLVDIYLPDFKFYSSRPAARYLKAADYPNTARQALAEMFRQVGPAQLNEDETSLQRGMIVRLLLLPGLVGDAKASLASLYTLYGDQIYFSLMRQYTPPASLSASFPEISRRVREDEYREWIDFAEKLGVEKAFTQEEESADESFIPSFHGQGLRFRMRPFSRADASAPHVREEDASASP